MADTTDKQMKDRAISIKGKDYVMVKDRINWLDENYNLAYSIDTDYAFYPEQRTWICKATLTIGEHHWVGLAQEVESDDYRQVNSTSALENCQTSAIGRAIACINVGIIDSFASANEIVKAINRSTAVVDPKLDLGKAKIYLIQQFKAKGVAYADQVPFIHSVTGKDVIDSVEEADKVMAALTEKEDV
jgi:hypothetical protein